MPTMSPSLRAGGFTRETVEEDMQSEACHTIKFPPTKKLIPEKLSPANQSRGTAKKHHTPVAPHGLNSARSMHSHRRFRSARCHRRHRGSARAGSGGFRLSHSTLEKK